MDEDNELAEQEGSVCEPKPASELEDCTIRGDRGLDVYYKEDLRDICQSDCRYLSNLSIGWLKGVTNLDALENRTVQGGIEIQKMPDLKTTRGLTLEDGVDVRLIENPRLEALPGFETLTEVRGLLVRANNLDDFDAFERIEGLTDVDSHTTVRFSQSGAQDVSGLDGLEVTDAEVRISNNTRFDVLPKFTGTPKMVYLTQNDELDDVSSLSSLNGVSDDFYVKGNPKLKGCHVEDMLDQLEVGPEADVTIRDNSPEPCN